MSSLLYSPEPSLAQCFSGIASKQMMQCFTASTEEPALLHFYVTHGSISMEYKHAYAQFSLQKYDCVKELHILRADGGHEN